MVFSSNVFVFLFLPVLLLAYAVTPKPLRNTLLLIASLFFYAWGEPVCVLLMIGSVVANYFAGLSIERWRGGPGAARVLAVAVGVNLAVLVFYKYANFLVSLANPFLIAGSLPPFALNDIRLPIGISFFTFHAISYLADVYRGDARVQRSILDFGLYIALFPQLVAGPIVKYFDIEDQLKTRHITRDGFAYGIKRFTLGMAKKLLIANTVGRVAEIVFLLPTGELTCGLAWLGIVCYTVQIYFDFSGYSDMAIGLGRMFGFKFLENFQYPYVAQSITDFWRRWHISLSTWFRNYLYIPLGGNRHGGFRTCVNLLIVFLLCGLWHGASQGAWNFILWGLFHGLFLVLERVGLGKLLERAGRPVRHCYVLLVVMVGWVFFRSPSVPEALSYLGAMAGFARGSGVEFHVGMYLNAEVIGGLAAGALFSTPILPALLRWREGFLQDRGGRPTLQRAFQTAFAVAAVAVFAALQAGIVAMLAVSTYNPFIYYRF